MAQFEIGGDATRISTLATDQAANHAKFNAIMEQVKTNVATVLGLWDGATGTEFAQVSTLVHELGHTLGLRHGGAAATAANPSPNCKPNYQSVMNYFFQVRGFLITPATPTTAVRLTVNGVPQGPVLDFSRQVLNPLFEKNLTETAITDAASNQQGVSFAHLGIRTGGMQAQPAGCLEPAGARCDQLDRIGVVSEAAVIAQPA